MSRLLVSDAQNSFFEERYRLQDQFDPQDLTPPFPASSLVELSNACNHSCVFCANPRMVRTKKFFDLELYRRFIYESASLGMKEVGLYTTGEPFFMKNLAEFVKIAKEAGIAYIFISTNGAMAIPEKVVPVIEAGLSSIKFSVNAGSRETYRLVHGQDDFEKVIANIQFISEYRKKFAPHLKMGVSCVVTKFIENEKENLQKMLQPLVDDIVFMGVEGQAGQALAQLSLLESSMTDPFPQQGKAKPCAMLWNRLHVTVEGYLSLCCVDYENSLTYADLKNVSVKEAWSNAVIQEMRRRHQQQKLKGTLCQNCLYGTREAVYPISDFGHGNLSESIESANPKGMQSVASRIEELSQKQKNR